MIGQTIGHYKLLDKLGEGGMGAVYLAEDLHLDRLAAIKLLPSERVADDERRKRFVREAKAASALNHANIITIYDIATADGISYIAMEYVRGQTLQDLIARTPLTVRDAVHYGAQIAGGRARAHSAGIIHRDLKPANIMVTPAGVVKVLDFGLAKLVDAVSVDDETRPVEGLVTQVGTVIGTAAYMSPEQAEGRPLGPLSDVFSFGCVLFELLTGQRAFRAGSTTATLAAILLKDVTPPRQLNGDIPPALEQLVLRCLQREPSARPQTMDEVRAQLAALTDQSTSVTAATGLKATLAPVRTRRIAAVAVLSLAALGALGLWLTRSAREASPPVSRILTRLTSDAGLSDYPALSPDGTQMVYASDRSDESNLDLWVRSASGGEPMALTTHPADDYEPSFSPDGKTIAFRSERDGGGVYLVAAAGGEARLVAQEGRRPRFSPDGKWIAYWSGGQGGAGIGERIFIVPAHGGAPQPWQPGVSTASYPVWSPDSTHILFLGKEKAASRWPETADWWVAPLKGGRATPTDAIDMLGRTAFLNFVAPELWSPDADAIVYSAKIGDTVNLWSVAISRRTWKVAGPPRQLTSGTGLEVHPSMAAGGRLVFSSLQQNDDVWLLGVAPQSGPPGPLTRVTQNISSDTMPSISGDGSRIAFLSNRLGHYEVWSRDLSTGKETALTRSAGGKMFPVISHDGSNVAFSTENGKDIHIVPTAGGQSKKVCDDCGLPRAWTRDGTRILYQGGEPRRFGLLDVATGARREVLQHPTFGIYSGRLSPDEKWIAFQMRVSSDRTRIFIAPFRTSPPVTDQEWIPVAEGPENDKPRWSAEGDRLYFTSFRDGFRCIWSQRLDPFSARPAGELEAVSHFHQTRRSMMNVPMYYRELAAAPGKLVFELGELIGNIWGVTVDSSR
jgi:serine/threonine protein kinase